MSGSSPAERIRAIFDRELQAAEDDCETSAYIEWFERLRDEVIAALEDDPA